LAFVLDNFLKNIVENCLWVIGVVDVLTDSKNVTTLFNVVLEVVVIALVGELRHFNFFSCKLLVKIVQIKAWWRQVFDAREKDRSL
jgi:hypothetical protein